MEKGLLALEQAQAIGEVQREEEPASALEYLQDIYKGKREPDHVRMKAARECLAFETPKLSATAIMHDENAFAIQLERAIQRSREGRVTLELSANPAATNGAGKGEAGGG
jgi:hypothetical protein